MAAWALIQNVAFPPTSVPVVLRVQIEMPSLELLNATPVKESMRKSNSRTWAKPVFRAPLEKYFRRIWDSLLAIPKLNPKLGTPSK